MSNDATIDFRLVGGCIVFGAGWSLGGFCPGPSVAAMMSGNADYVAFSFGMWVGYVAAHLFRRKSDNEDWIMTLGLGLVPFVFLVIGPIIMPKLPPPTDTWPAWRSVAGGLLIGLSATILMAFNGRVLGISGKNKHFPKKKQQQKTSPFSRRPTPHLPRYLEAHSHSK